MLESEYADAFKAWKATPTPQTSGALLRAVQPVISSAVQSYAPQGAGPTIQGRAKALALDAFQSYDPQRGRLRNHLLSNLQRLRRISAQQSQIIRMPERASHDMRLLDQARQELEDIHGRDIADTELADYTGLSLKRIGKIRAAVKPVAEGRFSESEDGPPPSESLTPQMQSWIKFVYDDLDARDQYILERSLGLNGRRRIPPTQIALKLGISPSAVSQRMARIQSMLDRREELGVL